MPVRELKQSPVLAVEHFGSFEAFRPNDVIGGGRSIPLHPGNFAATRAALALPGSRLVMQRSFARRLEADMGAPGTALIVPMSFDTHAEINGRPITGSTVALIRGAVPTRTLEPQANTCVMLRFHSDMQNRGWVDLESGFELFPAGSDAMNRIQTVLQNVFVQASTCVDVRQFAMSGEAMQESLLLALDDLLLSPKVLKPSPRSFESYRKLVEQIDELTRQHSGGMRSASGIAQNLGVSVRTLQTAVNVVHGTGLQRYVRQKRLWSVRHQLGRGLPGQTVKATALAHGFWHMGEFSNLYKATYGEKPSETLQRASLQ